MDAILGQSPLLNLAMTQFTFLGIENISSKRLSISGGQSFNKPDGCNWIYAQILAPWVEYSSGASTSYISQGIGIPSLFPASATIKLYSVNLDASGATGGIRISECDVDASTATYSHMVTDIRNRMYYYPGLMFIYFA